jgi:hypothetical protein
LEREKSKERPLIALIAQNIQAAAKPATAALPTSPQTLQESLPHLEWLWERGELKEGPWERAQWQRQRVGATRQETMEDDNGQWQWTMDDDDGYRYQSTDDDVRGGCNGQEWWDEQGISGETKMMAGEE